MIIRSHKNTIIRDRLCLVPRKCFKKGTKNLLRKMTSYLQIQNTMKNDKGKKFKEKMRENYKIK